MVTYIEKLRELLETPNVKSRAISSQANIILEGSTTIPGGGVHSSEWKCGASNSIMDDDIVYSCKKLQAA